MQTDWPVIGHENIKKFLGKSLEAGKIHHAYLFLGPAHVGKMTLAQIFSQALLCEKSSGSVPCGQCRACQAAKQGNHPDISRISPEEGTVSIETVRKFIGELSRSSLLGKRRVGIIDGAESLTTEAQNAMLKTLEEPSQGKVIILIARKPLLATIGSRVQSLKFNLIKESRMVEALEKDGAAHGEAQTLARLAAGRPGIALDFFHDKEKREKYEKNADLFLSLFKKIENFNSFAIAVLGKDLSRARERFSEISEAGLRLLRDFLLLKINLPGHTMRNSKETADGFLSRFSAGKIISLMKELQLLRSQVAMNVDPRFALENFYLLIN